MSSTKLAINGASSAYAYPLQDNITAVLNQNGGMKRIQALLHQRLDEAGWTQAVRDYVERLYRTGDATTFDDAVKIAKREIYNLDTNGQSNGVSNASNLTIPSDVKKDTIDVVRKELTAVVKADKDK